MRPLFLILLGCVTMLPATAVGQPSFPYKAAAVSDDVYVRSGPGQNYYATDKLKRGQQVEVYGHEPGGWSRIRPIDGSFTWVSGRFLKPTKHNLAVVTEEGVAARVGSRFGDVRDVIYVRLHKGEVVEILESPTGEGRSIPWYKIAPPSGEFRWVSSKYLDAQYPHDGLARHHADRRDAEPRNDDRNAEPSHHRRHDSEAAGESLLARSGTPRGITAKEFQEEYERIELELTVMLIEEPTTWSFDSLSERTNVLIDQSRTAVERGRARQLAGKIAKFEDIKRRQEEVLAMRDRTDRDSRLYARLRPRDDDDRDRSPARLEIDGRYDGVGQLARVPSPKTGAPRYALVDRSGDVRCYVTPAPGVRLQNYVGQKVGVTGSRSGYMIDQKASHIIARHITPLDGTMIR